jgi:predicted phage tail protein
MPTEKKLKKGKTKIQQRNEKFKTENKPTIKNTIQTKKTENKQENKIIPYLKTLNKTDWLQISIITILIIYIIFVILKYNLII